MVSRLPVESLIVHSTEVDATIAMLAEELDPTKNPNRLALDSLGVDRLGWTPEIYSEKAFEIWSNAYSEDNNDTEAIHHLAIMHHCRAIDLEESDDPSSSDHDWNEATRLWNQLWLSDPFWEKLAERAHKDGKKKIIKELREQLPVKLLRIHYDIALDPQTSMSRANFHVSHALSSPFPDDSKELARNQAYEEIAALLPDNIWQPGDLEVEEARSALDIIKSFLEKDPKCCHALMDSINISVKLIRTIVTEIIAAQDEEDTRSRLFKDIITFAEEWRPYFEQLADDPREFEEDMSRNLCLWCSMVSDAFQQSNKIEKAIDVLDLGASFDSHETEEGRLCQRKMVNLMALHARETTAGNPEEAKRLCQRLRQRDDLTILAHMLTANAYMFLGENETALEICNTGKELEPDFDNYRFEEEDEQALRSIDDLLNMINASIALDEARECMESNEHESALELLDRALELQPGYSTCHHLRAQCNLALVYPEAAAEDAQRFRDSFSDDREGLDAIGIVEERIKEQMERCRRCGRASIILVQQANKSLEDGDTENAIELLRRAVAASLPAGKNELKLDEFALAAQSEFEKEHFNEAIHYQRKAMKLAHGETKKNLQINLSYMLNAKAVRIIENSFNKAVFGNPDIPLDQETCELIKNVIHERKIHRIKNIATFPTGSLIRGRSDIPYCYMNLSDIISICKKLLREAIKLNPDDPNIRKNLDMLNKL